MRARVVDRRYTGMHVSAGLLLATAILAASSVTGFSSDEERWHPQYVLVNKMLGCTGRSTCWNEDVPSTCSQASFDEIVSTLGLDNITTMSSTRRIGISYQLNMLQNPNETQNVLQFLDNFLNLSEHNSLPVAITIDGFEFWDGVPQLWNFFDPSLPGYDADNVHNVEWTDWTLRSRDNRDILNATGGDATMLAWRDWGSQFRVKAHPNLASKEVLAAYVSAMQPALKMVSAWFERLPASKKWLLAYVKISWEAAIGTNYYFYPDGNKYLHRNVSEDPKTGVQSSAQLGYNAVCTLGLACSGNLSAAHLDAVVANFLATVAEQAVLLGLPRSKVLTHTGAAWDQSVQSHGPVLNSANSSLISFAQPGWSLYRPAYDPRTAHGLETALETINKTHWAASEWLYMGGNQGTPLQQWTAAINNTLTLSNNRLVDIFNWEGISTNLAALGAIRAVLAEPPSCLVDSPLQLQASVVDATPALREQRSVKVHFQWSLPFDSEAMTLTVSTSNATLVSGQLAHGDVIVTRVPQNSCNITLDLALPPTANSATVYPRDGSRNGAPRNRVSELFWTLACLGCGATQQTISHGNAIALP